VRGDAQAAALLAAAAARAAANLVAINLAAGSDNELVARAQDAADGATDSARFVLDL
jgi:formiminotetrahydrofolate cyclodeaminase